MILGKYFNNHFCFRFAMVGKKVRDSMIFPIVFIFMCVCDSHCSGSSTPGDWVQIPTPCVVWSGVWGHSASQIWPNCPSVMTGEDKPECCCDLACQVAKPRLGSWAWPHWTQELLLRDVSSLSTPMLSPCPTSPLHPGLGYSCGAGAESAAAADWCPLICQGIF